MSVTTPAVLILAGWYLPGFKAGGPIRTLSNVVAHLGDEFAFKLITRNQDLGDATSYPGVVNGEWQQVGKAKVLYLAPAELTLFRMRRLLIEAGCEMLYMNSMFSVRFTLLPLLLRRLHLIPRVPVVLAPRGELAPSALAIKSWKKRLFLPFAKCLRLYSGLLWQASSPFEADNIRRCFAANATVMVAPNLLPKLDSGSHRCRVRQKLAGYLNILYVSRIAPIKNLKFALESLRYIKGRADFNIYGPMEDPVYWAECREIVASLPENVCVNYHGEVEPHGVADLCSEHDLFYLPTLGENFGHAIYEALSTGCPVLISDQTPWQQLEQKGIGFEISLVRMDLFRKALNTFIAMDAESHFRWSERAVSFAGSLRHDQEIIDRNRKLFEIALAS